MSKNEQIDGMVKWPRWVEAKVVPREDQSNPFDRLFLWLLIQLIFLILLFNLLCSKDDLLTTLTRVNREVSKGDYLRHKQMPQPKYTLTKKLVLTEMETEMETEMLKN